MALQCANGSFKPVNCYDFILYQWRKQVGGRSFIGNERMDFESISSKDNDCVEVRAKSIKSHSQFEKQGFLVIGLFHPTPAVVNVNLY